MKTKFLMTFLISLAAGMTTLAQAGSTADQTKVNKVVNAYKKASCQDMQNGIVVTDNDQIVAYLQQYPDIREDYINKIAPTISAKLKQCDIN